MGGGSIIINRAGVLVTAAKDPCLYDTLPDHCKHKADVIAAKAPDQRTLQDVYELADIISVAVRC